MRKTLSILLVIGLLAGTLAAVAAADDLGDGDNYESYVTNPMPYYLSVTGIVENIEIADAPEGEGYTAINIVDTNGNPAKLIITENTVYPFETLFSTGDTVTGWYLADAPMITIWPPRYNTAVLAVGRPDHTAIQVDRFFTQDNDSIANGYMLSRDQMFAFKTDENTEIILANGDDFTDGDIEGRRIVVIYGPSTRSIPELAVAQKLIVLYEDIVPLEPLPDYDDIIDATGWPIVVDGVEIEAPEAFQLEDGQLMLPLRAIAEALGYEVKWDGAARTVTLGDEVQLTIGDPEGYVLLQKPQNDIVSTHAPVIRGGSTFVPMHFFRDIMNLPNAFAFEGRIEIDSEGERME
jgi:hypothetical protein